MVSSAPRGAIQTELDCFFAMLIDQAELIRRVSAQAVSTARQHLPFSVFTDLNDQLLTSIEQYLFTLRWPALRVVAAKGSDLRLTSRDATRLMITA